ncbi:MAG: ArnT family glycosyltransferase, partial [Candidatus Levyibacteriota bacterium]
MVKKQKKEKKQELSLFQKIIFFLKTYKVHIFFTIIFLVFLYLRFSNLGSNPFGYDQSDNAWAAKNIIDEHRIPLLGMVAKEDSGFYIGPFYYYVLAIVYWIFNLDPIASAVFAGLSAVFSVCILFFVAKKLFSTKVAFIAMIIQTVAFAAIQFDRVQWPVNFIPPVSLLIFYYLYNVLMGKPKHLIYLGVAVGLMFSVHFTAVFFPIIIFLCVPFFPWNKETIKYALLAIPAFFVWLVPNIISEIQSNSNHTNNLVGYIHSTFLGFHLVRVIQVAKDGFIQFEPFFRFQIIKPLKYMLLPFLAVVYYFQKPRRQWFVMVY